MSVLAFRKSLIFIAAAFAFLILTGIFAAPAHAEVSSVKVGDTYLYRSTSGSNPSSVDGVSYDTSSNTLTLENANITASNRGINVIGKKTDTVNIILKGTNTIAASSKYDFGIDTGTRLNISGTNLTVNNCWEGIVSHGLTVNSGTINLLSCSSYGIYSYGDIKLKGGTCNITTVGGNHYALYSSGGKISNKPVRLGKISGTLSEGACFKKKGSIHKVTHSGLYVALQKFGGKKKKVKIESVSFGGKNYGIEGIGAKAFKTKRGAKVKSIVTSSLVRNLGNKAFAGTKKLTKLDISHSSYLKNARGASIHKKAYSKCGKAGGKKLRVKIGRTYKVGLKQCKKFLRSKGLSKKAKITA